MTTATASNTLTLIARVYCGTYAKYNAGSIFGKWFDIDQFTDMEELYEEFRELHNDEEDPEFMFQDWETPDGLDGLISESHINKNLPEILDAIDSASYDTEIYLAYADNVGSYDLNTLDNWNDLIKQAEEAYQGEYDNNQDFAYEFVHSCYNLEGFAADYFDYEKFARDLMYDYFEVDGHYFRNC